MKISVSKKLKLIYEDYHKVGESKWRQITAKDKVVHILKLCNNVKHDRIFDVGLGDTEAVLAGLESVSIGTMS